MIKKLIKFIYDETLDFWRDVKTITYHENPFHVIVGRRCTYIYQWLKDGFSYRQLWGLDCTIAEFVIPRLEKLKEEKCGCPCKKKLDGSFDPVEKTDEYGHPESFTQEEWSETIDKMIFAFKFVLDDDKFVKWPADYKFGIDLTEGGKVIFKDNRPPDYTDWNTAYTKYKEGMTLFAVYFRDLWD